MDPSPARAEAAIAVAKKWFPDVLSGEPVKPEAVTWMSGLDPYSVKRSINDLAAKLLAAISQPRFGIAYAVCRS